MPTDIYILGLIVVVIWLVVLTFLVWRYVVRYNKIMEGTNEPTTAALLNKIATHHGKHGEDIHQLVEKVAKLEKQSLSHMQKIGLTRFNPFRDTGGDQSFILALLDAEDNGVVISGLFSRAGTRWYAKKVEKAKGVEYELSEEEKKAIARAK